MVVSILTAVGMTIGGALLVGFPFMFCLCPSKAYYVTAPSKKRDVEEKSVDDYVDVYVYDLAHAVNLGVSTNLIGRRARVHKSNRFL